MVSDNVGVIQHCLNPDFCQNLVLFIRSEKMCNSSFVLINPQWNLPLRLSKPLMLNVHAYILLYSASSTKLHAVILKWCSLIEKKASEAEDYEKTSEWEAARISAASHDS